MGRTRKRRDSTLIDAIEAIAPLPFSGPVWRVTREGRDPTRCSGSGGRWDDGAFDVLYTSAERLGAISEMKFHIERGQPVPLTDCLKSTWRSNEGCNCRTSRRCGESVSIPADTVDFHTRKGTRSTRGRRISPKRPVFWAMTASSFQARASNVTTSLSSATAWNPER